MASDRAGSLVRPRRWPRRFLILLALLCGVVFLAPSLVARTALKQKALDFAGQRAGLSIHVDDLQLGWLSAVRANGLRVETLDGQPIAQADSIFTQLPLWKLVWRPRQFGLVQAEGLVAHVRLREGGSSLEDLLGFTADESPPRSTTPRTLPLGQVKLRDAMLQVSMDSDPRTWEVRLSHAEIEIDGQADAPLRSAGEAEIIELGQGRGQLRWEARMVQADSSEGVVRVRAETLPLTIVDAVARRFGQQVACQGAATVGVQYQWADGFASHHARFDAGTALESLQVSAPRYLGDDVLRLQRVSLTGEAELLRDLLRVRQLQLDSDVGRATADGELRLQQLQQALASGGSGPALNGQVRIEGAVQLAELAGRLPRTLQLRDDTHVTAGQLAFQLQGAPIDGGCQWTGRLRAEGLQGVTAGRNASLRAPISIDLTALQHGTSWSVSQLVGRSSFLQCDGNGGLQAGALRASANLRQLHSELGQFVDLSSVKLAGTIDVQLDWRRIEGQRVQLQGNSVLRELEVELPGYDAVRESELQTAIQAVGTWDELKGQLTLLENGQAEISAAGDRLRAELLQAVNLQSEPRYVFSWTTNGDLDRWVRRLQPLVRLPGWTIAGNLRGSGKLAVTARSLQIEATQLDLEPLRVSHASLRIDEPRAQLNTSGELALSESTLRLGPTTLMSSTIAARTDNFAVTWKTGGTEVRGDISMRGDLGRVNAMFQSADRPGNQQLLGQLEGRVSLLMNHQGIGFDTLQTVKQLSVAHREAGPQGPQTLPASVGEWKTVWSEPELRLAAQGVLGADFTQLQLSRLSAAADGIELSGQGSLSELTSLMRVDLQGDLSYDLSRLVEKLRAVLGDSVQVEGVSSRPFALRGALLSPEASQAKTSLAPLGLSARGGVGWDRAELAGVEVGPGLVQAALEQGVVRCEPVSLAVVQGRLQLTPTFDLNGSTPRLLLAPGRIAEGLTITPQMCQTWLKFVAPLVADATAVQGVFSADLNHFDMPISDLRDANIEGRVVLQQARVGPGPLSNQFLQIAQQVEAIIKGRAIQRDASQWMTLPAQEVPFAMRQGRVAHRGLTMRIDDLEIRTQGDVGLDQSLALVAEVVVPSHWIADQKLLGSLANQPIQIPIRGTLQRPQVDTAALARLGQQMVGGAARGLLEGELDKALKKLFK